MAGAIAQTYRKPMNIVLATRNGKKIEEIKRIVRDMPVTIYTLDDFPGMP